MSLLRKIRRRRKPKKSAQANSADGDVAVCSGDDGEAGDVDSDANATMTQVDVQNAPFPLQKALSANDAIREVDSAVQSSFVLSPITSHTFILGERSRFWPRIVTTSILVLVSSGAFYIGKMATLWITLSILLACRLCAWNWLQKSESLSQKVTPACLCDERTSKRQEIMSQHSAGTGEHLCGLLNVEEGNEGETELELTTSQMDENGDPMMTSKQLKPLNCTKLPQPVVLFGEDKEEPSPSTASPRKWFRNVGRHIVTQNRTNDHSPEFREMPESKSKALIRRLRKASPHSAPSSPSGYGTDAWGGFSIASDGSYVERTTHDHSAKLRRKSKFRPASPVGDGVSDENVGQLRTNEETVEQLKFGKHVNRASPLLSDSTLAGVTRKENDVISALYKAKLRTQHNIPTEKEKSSSGMPPMTTSRDDAAIVGLAAGMVNCKQLPCKKGESHKVARNPLATSALQETRAKGQSTSALSMSKGLHRRQPMSQKSTLAIAWLTGGLAIITSGLLMGRIVAVAALIGYWYAVSLLRARFLI